MGRRPGARADVQKQAPRAAEPDRPDGAAARSEWRPTTAPAWDPGRVVFGDETAANTTHDRRYGYAPRGEPVVGRVPPGHYKSLTFTAALRSDGVTAGQVLGGPMTGIRFRGSVTAVRVPTPRPGGTVVGDHLPCHKGAGVRAATEGAGGRLVFLPPDRPDFNPIELAFAKRKRALRTDGHREVPKRMTFLRAAGGIFRPDECRADIRHGGYGEPATLPPK